MKTVAKQLLALKGNSPKGSKKRYTKSKNSKKVQEHTPPPPPKVEQPSINYNLGESQELEQDILFSPNAGPQTDFLASSEREVLYGGAAGGGKSFAMLAAPLRGLNDPNFSGLLVSHTTEELRELIQKSQELYPKAIPGIKWSERKSQWTTPNWGRLWMS